MKTNLIRLIFVFVVFVFTPYLNAKEKSHDGLLCAATYYIASGAYEDAKTNEIISSIQLMFQDVYSAKRNDRHTNGELSKLKHDLIFYLDELYSKDPDQVYNIEMKCNAWREKLAAEFIRLEPFFESLKDDPDRGLKFAETFRSLPNMPQKNYDGSDSRWLDSQLLMDYGFAVWRETGKNTPYSAKQLLIDSLKNGN